MNHLNLHAIDLAVIFATRCLLVALFLPFSALDKLLNFDQAVHQASQIGVDTKYAITLIIGAFCVEVIMSVGVVTGLFDRMAALLMALYCMATAMLWKQFWKADFRLKGESRGREVFWDFCKNLSVAGGFLIVTFGLDSSSAHQFLEHPWASTNPYGH